MPHSLQIKSPISHQSPVRHFEHVTNRTFFKKKPGPTTGGLGEIHKSESLESSRRWYAQQVAELRLRGRLFEDPYFPANDTSIKPDSNPALRHYEWLRPHDLTTNPKFIIDGISRFDVQQGEIGDCWFLAAVTSLSLHKELLEQVVPVGQSFDGHHVAGDRPLNYCGMFWFRFWRFGDWYDVVVDDRLPTRQRQLVYLHSSNRNEFWSPLLEKAYAKLFGSYEAIKGGNTAEAMEDLTGGLTELVDLGPRTPANLFSIMERAHHRSSLMGCAIDAAENQVETEGPFGLILGHAYSVTDVRQFRHVTKSGESVQMQLVRLHNPWGNEHEWTGPWSDQSPEWKSISSTERRRIGLVFDTDGEFWMSMEDFVRYFSRLDFCHLGPESASSSHFLRYEHGSRRWEMAKKEGEWVRYSTAGGCRNYEQTFYTNPQFRVQVYSSDASDPTNAGTVVIGLMQRGRREQCQPYHTIGYAVYPLPPNYPQGKLLPRSFFQSNISVCRSPSFVNLREICGRHKLPPGEYMIIPSTFEPNCEAKFLLRIFSERPCKAIELDEEIRAGHDKLIGLSEIKLEDENAEQLEKAFKDIDRPCGGVTATELLDLLNVIFVKDFEFSGFSRETARSMVAMMDTDLNGSLDFAEFKKLWMELRLFKTMFKEFDRDGSGSFDAHELRELLRALGFQVSNKVYNAIVERYADSKGQISFDDYLLLLVRLVKVAETFKAHENIKDNTAAFEFEDFMRTVMYI